VRKSLKCFNWNYSLILYGVELKMAYPAKPEHDKDYHPGKNLTDPVNFGNVGKAMEGNPVTKHFAPAFKHIHDGKHHGE